MSRVHQNIDPPPPFTARRVCAPRGWCEGRTHSLGGEGGGGSEDARHSSILYTRKYFVVLCICRFPVPTAAPGSPTTLSSGLRACYGITVQKEVPVAA